jgi:hypothetical protein
VREIGGTTMVLDFLPDLDPESSQGSIGRLALQQLRPTQNAVGMDEVEAKVQKIREMGDKKLEDYLLQRPVPVIIGNESSERFGDLASPFYMVDHHHLAAALWYARQDPETRVFAEVRRKWLPLSGDRLWKAMARNAW